MTILTCTGELLPRDSVYDVPINQYRKHKKKPHSLVTKTAKRKYRLTEKQACMIIDRQIARKLQQMF